MLIKKIIIKTILLYQKTISPDHGLFFKHKYPFGCCCFYPTCSEYAKIVLKKYSLIKAFSLIAKRAFKCNPFTKPTIDIPIK